MSAPIGYPVGHYRRRPSLAPDLRGNECDPHLALARSESREGPGLTCGTCGKRAEGNYSDDAGPVCDACIEAAR